MKRYITGAALGLTIAFSSYLYAHGTDTLEVRGSTAIEKNTAIEKLGWDGEWVLEGSMEDHSGTLVIENQTPNSFHYSLDTYYGTHVGSLEGEAKVIGRSASSTVGSDKESQCQVYFNKRRDGIIKVKTTNYDCSSFRGMGGFFEGNYVKDGPTTKRTLGDLVYWDSDSIFKNDDEINAFKKLVGDSYVELFTSSFQRISREDDTEHLNARIYTGGVKGLYTILEGIIIIGSKDKIWAAVIDNNVKESEDGVVRYFTNVPNYRGRLPQTIDKWRENFKDKKVILMNGVKKKEKNNPLK